MKYQWGNAIKGRMSYFVTPPGRWKVCSVGSHYKSTQHATPYIPLRYILMEITLIFACGAGCFDPSVFNWINRKHAALLFICRGVVMASQRGEEARTHRVQDTGAGQHV